MKALGIRQNNPGNLEASVHSPWEGEITSPDRFACFISPIYGLRALLITLKSYIEKDHCVTIGDIVNRWAPRVENDTQAYIDDVCQYANRMNQTNWTEETVISPTSVQLIIVGAALVHHENGEQPYSFNLWNMAWAQID